MTGLRPNRPPAEALQAELTAENEPPSANAPNLDSRSVIDTRLEDAWAGMESAADDSEWVEWFMIWLELSRLKFGPDPGESETP